MLDRKKLEKYENWIGETPWDVYMAVKTVGGWQNVFLGPLPIWASRIRQYFNVNPMSLTLLDGFESKKYYEEQMAGTTVKLRVKTILGVSYIENTKDVIGELKALSGHVYEDSSGRSIWFQTSPGAGVYHFPTLPSSPELAVITADQLGQARSPVFKLVCPDGTGGSRECVVTNNGRTTIGAVYEEVNLADRFVKDSVRQGSYNYAETIEKGLAAHDRLDVNTDPMRPGYFVEPPDLFQFSELYTRRFPPNDPQGRPLANQTGPAP